MKIFKSKITYAVSAIILIAIICICMGSVTRNSIKTVGSYGKLDRIYKSDEYEVSELLFLSLFPFNLLY